MQWCLGGSSVRQKSPVEVQHAQESTDLTGGLWRVAVLEMGHSLFQRLRSFGGHLVTEEDNLGCSEDAIRRVDDDPIPLELGDESSQVLFVLFKWPGKDKDVVQVGETETESPPNAVHEALKRLGGVAQAEGHEGEFE
jgi:hypothetical protein